MRQGMEPLKHIRNPNREQQNRQGQKHRDLRRRERREQKRQMMEW